MVFVGMQVLVGGDATRVDGLSLCGLGCQDFGVVRVMVGETFSSISLITQCKAFTTIGGREYIRALPYYLANNKHKYLNKNHRIKLVGNLDLAIPNNLGRLALQVSRGACSLFVR